MTINPDMPSVSEHTLGETAILSPDTDENPFKTIGVIEQKFGTNLKVYFGITDEMIAADHGYARKRKFYHSMLQAIYAVRNNALSQQINRKEMEASLTRHLRQNFDRKTIGNRVDTRDWATVTTPPVICDMLYPTDSDTVIEHQTQFFQRLPQLHKYAEGDGKKLVGLEEEILCEWMFDFLKNLIPSSIS